MPENAATRWPNYHEADFILKDYRLASGEVLPELKLHYRTIGVPQRDAAGKIVNGVLLAPGQYRHRRELAAPEPRRRAVRAGPAARCARLLHHHAGRDRPRRVVEAVGRAARAISRITATATWSTAAIG